MLWAEFFFWAVVAGFLCGIVASILKGGSPA